MKRLVTSLAVANALLWSSSFAAAQLSFCDPNSHCGAAACMMDPSGPVDRCQCCSDGTGGVFVCCPNAPCPECFVDE